jgi:cytidyltransferase-like protein
MKKIVITYGTFALFHIGHLKLLQRLIKKIIHLENITIARTK